MKGAGLVFLLLALATAGSTPFSGALDMTFALQSSAIGASNHDHVQKAITALMRRHSIPLHADELRNMSDERLMQLAMLAAVGSVSAWRRSSDNQQLLLDDHGALLREHTPGVVEADIMLSIVCTLLAVIVMFHVVPPAVIAPVMVTATLPIVQPKFPRT